MSRVTLLASDASAASLLPGGGRKRVDLVLFYRPSDPTEAKALASLEAGLPSGVSALALDVDSVPKVAEWFGVRATPMLAAIADGAMLMLEADCSPGRCGPVLADALDRLRTLEGEAAW